MRRTNADASERDYVRWAIERARQQLRHETDPTRRKNLWARVRALEAEWQQCVPRKDPRQPVRSAAALWVEK